MSQLYDDPPRALSAEAAPLSSLCPRCKDRRPYGMDEVCFDCRKDAQVCDKCPRYITGKTGDRCPICLKQDRESEAKAEEAARWVAIMTDALKNAALEIGKALRESGGACAAFGAMAAGVAGGWGR